MSDVRPILIGAGNALEMTGKPWPWWRRHAAELGILLLKVGTATFARAADVLAAVERHAAAPVTLADEDELEAMRARIRRAG